MLLLLLLYTQGAGRTWIIELGGYFSTFPQFWERKMAQNIRRMLSKSQISARSFFLCRLKYFKILFLNLSPLPALYCWPSSFLQSTRTQTYCAKGRAEKNNEGNVKWKLSACSWLHRWRHFVAKICAVRPSLSTATLVYTNYGRKLNYLVHVEFPRVHRAAEQKIESRIKKTKRVSVADVTYSLVSFNLLSAPATLASPLIVATVFRNFISGARSIFKLNFFERCRVA